MIIMGTSRQRARSSDGLSVHVEVPGGPHPPRWYERPEPDSCWGRRAPWPTCTPAVGWTSRGGVDGETYRGNESSRRVIASRLSPRGRRLSFLLSFSSLNSLFVFNQPHSLVRHHLTGSKRSHSAIQNRPDPEPCPSHIFGSLPYRFSSLELCGVKYPLHYERGFPIPGLESWRSLSSGGFISTLLD